MAKFAAFQKLSLFSFKRRPPPVLGWKTAFQPCPQHGAAPQAHRNSFPVPSANIHAAKWPSGLSLATSGVGVWGKSCPDSLPHYLSSQPQTSEGHANLQGIRKHGKNFLDISVIFLLHKNAFQAKQGKRGGVIVTVSNTVYCSLHPA